MRAPATLCRRFTVAAAPAEVYRLLSTPAELAKLIDELDSFSLVDERRARWRFRERQAYGLRVVGEGVVEHAGNGRDQLSWTSVDGNVEERGQVELHGVDGGTEVSWRETFAVELPVTNLMLKLFRRPLVEAERARLARTVARVERTLAEAR